MSTNITDFDSWDDMLKQATNDYLSSELSL